MKKKSFLYIILIILLMFTFSSLLIGCNDKHDRIKVSIGMWPEASDPQNVAMFTEWKEAFEKDYPQYEIVADPYTYNPDTFVAKAASGQLPTVFQTYFTEPEKLISNGFIKDITSHLHELDWYDKMDPDMRETVSKGGKVYGVPRDGYGLGLFLNLEMLYDVGVITKNPDNTYNLYDELNNPLYPTTFQDIYDVSELIVQGFDNTYGLVVLSADKNGGWQFSNFAWNFGVEALQVKSNGNWTANLNDPAAVEALSWIQKMRQDGLISPDASLSYVDWYAKIGSRQAAMAFAGSDALALPVTNFNFDKDNIAFVPMPTGDGESYHSLFGGTPYVFSERATDEQVRGALLFLKYMGRSPETDEISIAAMRKGNEVAQAKNLPILPTIKPWINEDYLTVAQALEDEFINVNMDYYKDFFNGISVTRKAEEPHFCQEMYSLLDNALQEILSNPFNANPLSVLTTANSQFQSAYMSKVQ